MRRRLGYSALGTILIAAAVGLWAWRWDGAAAVHSDVSQSAVSQTPSVTAAPTDVLAPVPAMAAVPMTAAPAAPAPAGASMTVAPPAEARPAASFDVVRVNPQGNAVIAGRALPNADVVAFDGDAVIGRATADKRGEWVILPEAALPPGPHTLRIDVPTPSDQRTAAAPEEISITIPVPSAAIVAAAMPTVSRPSAVPTSPRTVPEDRPTSLETVQTKPAQGISAQGTLVFVEVARDKAAQDKAARDKSLVVQPGNSLWRIARNSYGAGRHYAVIYSANRDRIGDPDLIYPGQVFMLPEAN
jgi:nucleoid-associated protein YgaU